MQKNRVIAIIPARGGSKGIPRKNIRTIAGKPMIAWTIEEAKKSKYLDRIIVSTDDKKTAEISRKYGAEVVMRPKELATDDSPVLDTIRYTMKKIKEKGVVVLLQPTSPLRTYKDIDGALSAFLCDKSYNSMISVCETSKSSFVSFEIQNPYIIPIFDWTYFGKQRHDIPKTYQINGAIFIMRTDKGFFTDKTGYYIMPKERSIDIDDEFDFRIAEILLKER